MLGRLFPVKGPRRLTAEDYPRSKAPRDAQAPSMDGRSALPRRAGPNTKNRHESAQPKLKHPEKPSMPTNQETILSLLELMDSILFGKTDLVVHNKLGYFLFGESTQDVR